MKDAILPGMTSDPSVDRDRLASLMADETAGSRTNTRAPPSFTRRALESLLEGVPMPWMVKWAGPFPPYVESASGATSAASTGTTTWTSASVTPGPWPATAPLPTIAAVERQMRLGITHMLPTEDAAWVGEELSRRFGLASWQFALSATDANRWLAPPRTAHQRPLQGRRPRPLLPRVGGRGDRRAGRRTAPWCPSMARSARRSMWPRRRASSSSTTSPGWRPRSPIATSPPC